MNIDAGFEILEGTPSRNTTEPRIRALYVYLAMLAFVFYTSVGLLHLNYAISQSNFPLLPHHKSAATAMQHHTP